MLTVTIVAHDVGARVGGMESQLERLAQGLLDEGARVIVIARRCELPAQQRLTWLRVRTPARPFAIGYPLFALAASWIVARRGAGVVHATGAIVFNRVDCITVHFCHVAYRAQGLGSRPSSPGRLFALNAAVASLQSAWAERWCYRRSRVRATIAVSPGVREEMEHYFPGLAGAVTMIPHGVDTDRFRPDPARGAAVRARLGLAPDDLVAVFVGGDWARKGLRRAIDAVAGAPGWSLLIVGHGHEETYAQHARELEVQERVLFAGVTRDVPAYLAAADVFLLPTRYETFCLVAFEAAAAALPLLVTRVSGPDLIVEPGRNGDFIDDDAARTAALLDGYRDAERRHRHGARARQRAAEFSWPAAQAAHLRLYAELARTSVEAAAEAVTLR